MQLKTIGESLTVTKTIDKIINSTSHLGNAFMDEAVKARFLAQATKGYSLDAVKAAIAQSSLNETQIRAILIEQELQGETLETTTAQLAQAAATNAQDKAHKKAATSSLGFGKAMTGLGATIKPLAKSLGVLAALISLYVGIRKVSHDGTYEKLSKEIEELSKKYEENEEKLSEINSQLEENHKRIQEMVRIQNKKKFIKKI